MQAAQETAKPAGKSAAPPPGGNGASAPEKAAKPKTEVTPIKMTDGRIVNFAGKKKMVKEASVDDKGNVNVRFDFRTGDTRTFTLKPSDALYGQFAAHGASQKIGDETAGEEKVEDMVVAVDDMISRLAGGEWGATRAAGDSFSGASIVIKAICEVNGKSPDVVKAFLQKKLDSTPGLTRQKLYASFRDPASKTGQVILRLESEKNKAAGGPSAGDLLAEMG